MTISKIPFFTVSLVTGPVVKVGILSFSKMNGVMSTHSNPVAQGTIIRIPLDADSNQSVRKSAFCFHNDCYSTLENLCIGILIISKS